MTTHYESVHPVTLYPDAFHVAAPDTPVAHDLFPRRPGVFIRKMHSPEPAPVLEPAPELASEPASETTEPAEPPERV